MLIWIRRVFMGLFLLLVILFQAYLLSTESQLLYGLLPLFLASFFLFERPIRGWRLSDYLLLCFLALLSCSFFFSQHPFGFFEFTTFFVGALLYYAVRFLPLPQQRYSEMFVGAAALLSAFALIYFLLTPADRLSGIFHGEDPYMFYANAAALFLLPVLAFNVELCFSKSRMWHGLLMLNFSAFFLTFSRGAYGVALLCASLAGLIFILSFFKKKNLKKSAHILLALLLGLGLAFTLNALKVGGPVVAERLVFRDDAGFASVTERMDFWKGAMQMTMDHPWFGVGPGGFEAYYPAYQDHWLALSDHPHNVLLKLSSEAGFPTALLFVGFLLSIFGGVVWRWYRKGLVFGAGLVFASLAFLLHNFLDYNLNFSLLSAVFFILLAGLENENDWRSEKLKSPRWPGFYGLTVLCLMVSAITVWEGMGLVQAKYIESLHKSDPTHVAVQAYVFDHPALPFEMNRFDLIARLALDLGETRALETFLDAFPSYKNYHRWLYFKTRLDPSFSGALLAANSKNELEYYYLYYKSRPSNAEDAGAIEKLIETYTVILSENAHLTVLSQNPLYAEALCELYPNELQKVCSVFAWIWSLEVYKFNQRYGTELVTQSKFIE